jgi:hypothetical protein
MGLTTLRRTHREQISSALPPDSDRLADIPDRQLRANSGREQVQHFVHKSLAYSITLSARDKSSVGSSWFIAFAVLRLITSANLVGCSTGRSAGLLPRSSLASYRLMMSRNS